MHYKEGQTDMENLGGKIDWTTPWAKIADSKKTIFQYASVHMFNHT